MKKTKNFIFFLAVIASFLTAYRYLKISQNQLPAYQLQETEKPAPSKILPENNQTSDQLPPQFTTITINNHILNVEIAATSEEISAGLSGRDRLDSDGLLFIFDTVDSQIFWMKDMNFPIDLVWITNGKITGIIKNLPVPQANTPENNLILYQSPGNVTHVLELPAGKIDELQIKINDQIITNDPIL